jgi:hypothetical protein
VSRRRQFLILGNQSHPPRLGSPLGFCDTVFPDLCLPEGYSYSVSGAQASCFLLPFRNFEVKFLKWHAAVILEIHATLSSRPRCSREADAVSPGADNLVSGNFHRWGRTEIHFCLSDTAEMYMPPLLLDWPRMSCYENRTDAYGLTLARCDRRCPSESRRKEPHCNHARFSVPKSENPGGRPG